MIAHLINSNSVASNTIIEDLNPATGDILAEVVAGGEHEVDAEVSAAKAAFPK